MRLISNIRRYLDEREDRKLSDMEIMDKAEEITTNAQLTTLASKTRVTDAKTNLVNAKMGG